MPFPSFGVYPPFFPKEEMRLNIMTNKRILTLLAALLMICTALAPAMAESAGEAEAPVDKLFAAIDEKGYAYLTAAENTIFYSDPALTQEAGLLRKKVTVTATEYVPEGLHQTGTAEDGTPIYAEAAVLVWITRGDEPESFYVRRSAVKNPLKETAIVNQAEKEGMEMVAFGAASAYVHEASIKPLVDSDFVQWWINLIDDFYKNIIEYERWKLLLSGLANTLLMTAGALGIGVVIGVAIALVCTAWENNGAKLRGAGRFVLRFMYGFFRVYTTIFRGTPMMVQLLLMTFVILKGIPHAMTVAIISFGLNSGAYVAEIFRGGINSIDKGQMEAGRSIGMSYAQTMWHIIAPQVIKNVLPTLCNEFITLIKETSIAAYAGVMELTMAGNRIRGQTFSDFMPLIAVAVIYLVLVMILTWAVGILERRLRQSDAR